MIVFISGGARSGKSHYAEELALQRSNEQGIAYVATGQAMDVEFRQRIRHHQARRSPAFHTYEEAIEIDRAVAAAIENHSVVLLECITTWLGNVFHHGLMAAGEAATAASEAETFAQIENSAHDCIARLIAQAQACPDACIIIVSNEIGLGLVPPDAMSRAYRDMHGRINRQLATVSGEAWLIVSGLPVRLR